MELYEQIRREDEFGAGSVNGVARKLGVHRRMVREAVRNAVSAQRKKTARPLLKMAAAALIEAILDSDRKVPRKQRHTAHGFTIASLPRCPGARRPSGRCGRMLSGGGRRLAWENGKHSYRRVMSGASRRKGTGTRRMQSPLHTIHPSSGRCEMWKTVRVRLS